MRPFSGYEVERLQDAYEGGMQDACVLLRWQPATKTYLADEDETACRFRDATASPPGNVFLASATTPGARIVLPQAATLGKNDRVRLTKRWGRAVTNTDYQQIGAVEPTALGQIVELRKVAT